MPLFLDIGVDDVLMIDDMEVSLEYKSGARARLSFKGAAKVTLVRNGKSIAAANAGLPRVGVAPTSDAE